MGIRIWCGIAEYGPRAGTAKPPRPAAALAAAGALAALLAWGASSPVAAEPAAVTIAALGDSLTQGYGLAQGDGFVPQLQEWLDARQVGAEIVNAGVSGDTTAGGLARIGWTLTPEVDALIVALGGNDLLRGIDPAASRANLDAILTRAGAKGLPVLLIGMTAPGNYGPDYKAAFDAIYPEIAAAHGARLYPEFLAGVTEDRSLWQPDAIHPNAEGVAVIVDGIGPEVMALLPGES